MNNFSQPPTTIKEYTHESASKGTASIAVELAKSFCRKDNTLVRP